MFSRVTNPPKRWYSGVSPKGDRVLGRRDGAASNADDDLQYSFSQGLTFLSRRWRNVMDKALLELGQSHVHWHTLYWISLFADRINQTQLAECMGIEQPTVGRVLRELEADGLIVRRVQNSDRRALVIDLTLAAKPLMRKTNRVENILRAAFLKDVAPAELAGCLTVFAKILENIDGHEAKQMMKRYRVAARGSSAPPPAARSRSRP